MECPLCKSVEKKKFAEVESFGFPLIYYACQNCGLIFQSAEESLAASPTFYEETYRRIYQAKVSPTKKDLWVQSQRAEHLVQLLEIERIKTQPKILDIGASSGLLLKALQKAFEGSVVGVEPGEAYRAYAETQGVKMFPSIETLIEIKPAKFDLISMMHVLEHLPDPVFTLQQIREHLLAPDGILLLEVPNFFAHDSYELAHLTCFTSHTLQETLKQAGYKIHNLVKHGKPRSSLLKLYITVLAKPLSNISNIPPVKNERLVGAKRKLGLLYRRLVQKFFPGWVWQGLPTEEE